MNTKEQSADVPGAELVGIVTWCLGEMLTLKKQSAFCFYIADFESPEFEMEHKHTASCILYRV